MRVLECPAGQCRRPGPARSADRGSLDPPPQLRLRVVWWCGAVVVEVVLYESTRTRRLSLQQHLWHLVRTEHEPCLHPNLVGLFASASRCMRSCVVALATRRMDLISGSRVEPCCPRHLAPTPLAKGKLGRCQTKMTDDKEWGRSRGFGYYFEIWIGLNPPPLSPLEGRNSEGPTTGFEPSDVPSRDVGSDELNRQRTNPCS